MAQNDKNKAPVDSEGNRPTPVAGAPTQDERALKEKAAQEKAQKAAADKAKKDAEKAKAAQAQAEKQAGKFVHFKSTEYSGLMVVKEDGSHVRFTPHLDTFKGDTVKVGYLRTDDAEVVERLKSLGGGVVEIDEKEFKEATDSLELAPVYSV